MKLIIINGPNLNLLGTREQEIYGSRSFEQFLIELRDLYHETEIGYFQSNIEGELITAIQDAASVYEGIILNAAGYTHTSVSIADAVKTVNIPVIEVHISNIFARESFRHTSMIAPFAKGSIIGFGLESYRLAVESFMNGGRWSV